MIAEQWQRAQTVFHAVADLDPSEQGAEVHRQCADDPALAAAILDMLDEDRKRHTLLDADLTELAHAALQGDRVQTLQEQRIGPYRLLRLLGEGGTGVVYLADRSDFGVLVAIKLLRHAWLSPMRRARFALEQQTLARLNHPAIARIYDASTLADGTPWFAMEYVDGKTLTGWLAANDVSLRDRLLIFRQVCEAVRYAHSLAIVHRDLKPSNILIAYDGQVKLLDFGIAKHLDPGGEWDRTVDGMAMLTPAYAAPEQRLGGQAGVFTDVYSLGVILYEMLTGVLPEHCPPGIIAPPVPLTVPLTPPSRAAGRLGKVDNNGLSSADWADLDALCLTACALLTEDRYRTVDALVQDLDALLAGRPLVARRRSRRDVFLKFVRRHRAALAAATAVTVLLLITFTAFTVRLARARDTAVVEAARVSRMERFTESLFDGGDREAGPSREIKTSELLKRGETEAESLHSDPRMQADMLETLGSVYRQLGSLDKADALLRRSLAERRDRFGESDAQYTDSLMQLGLLRKDQRRLPEAEKLFQNAVDRSSALHDASGLQAALVKLGSVLSLRGQYDRGQEVLQRALQMEAQTRPDDPAERAETLTELADIAFYRAAYDRSQSLYEQALALDRSLYGDRHPKTAQVLNSLGAIASNEGNTARAESLLRQSLAADLAWYGPDHPDVASDYTSLSNVLVLQKRFDEADSLLQRALVIQRSTYGEQHAHVAEAWNQIGVLAYARGRDDVAELALRKALAIYTAVYGPSHQFVGLAYSNLIGVYTHCKDYAEAERCARKALQIYAVSLPADHINPAITHIKLGRILLREKNYAEAAPETLKGYKYLVGHHIQGAYLDGARSDLIEINGHLAEGQVPNKLREDILFVARQTH